MSRLLLRATILLSLTFLSTSACSPKQVSQPEIKPVTTLYNLAHLNFLSEWGTLRGIKVHYTWVYADQVDGSFRKIQADNMGHVEGKACVDDVARAALVYLDDFVLTGNQDSYQRALGSLEFILQMQAEDGEFYNFIYLDNTRNETGITSKKSHGWWAVRALWAMAKGLSVLKDSDAETGTRLKTAVSKLIPILNRDFEDQSEQSLLRPDGALMSSAALGLAELLKTEPQNQLAAELLAKICDRFVETQHRQTEGPASMLYGAQFSHPKEEWHGWGNRQTWALAAAAIVLAKHPNKDKWLDSARLEADAFYSKLIATHIPRAIHQGRVQPFDQIAYAIGSMVSGLTTLYQATQDKKYAQLAGLTGSWFFGNNPAKKPVYQSKSGVCLDGIRDYDDMSDNSGAESTIEALLALQSLTKIKEAQKFMYVKSYQDLPNFGRSFILEDDSQVDLVQTDEQNKTYQLLLVDHRNP
jgi:hypothetical protein